jgi:hypothetical protein
MVKKILKNSANIEIFSCISNKRFTFADIFIEKYSC